MATFDVCNGDADGLCAAMQWRLHQHRHDQGGGPPVTLVTGLKRDIELLKHVPAQRGDDVNVFDISMLRNHVELQRLLAAGVRVRYFDHHQAPEGVSHPLLESYVDRASDVCTSLLVDRHLGGAYRAWALVGAYGDNLGRVADQLAAVSGFSADDCQQLRRLGEVINYNAYGDSDADVCIAPAWLFKLMLPHRDPRDLLASEGIVDEIDEMRQADLRQAMGLTPVWQGPQGRVLVLPDAPWARRVLGCLANELANAQPSQAHAVLKAQAAGEPAVAGGVHEGAGASYAVSVRAPLSAPMGADKLCSAFGGGGRARAAGIDELPVADLNRFIAAFAAMRWGEPV